jgi:hypothetical protein
MYYHQGIGYIGHAGLGPPCAVHVFHFNHVVMHQPERMQFVAIVVLGDQ